MRAIWITALLVAPLSAQWIKLTSLGIPRTPDGKPDLTAPAPRTPDGRPDLSGMWLINGGPNAGNIASGLAPGEIQPWAAEVHQRRKENLGDEAYTVLCLPGGPLYSVGGSPEGLKIVQTPALVVILYGDMIYRQIHLDGRSLPVDPNPTWMGYSVGRWEGDTLVVESNGFNERTWLDFEGHPHSEGLLMTERYRRLDLGHMNLEVTFRDPRVYAKPLTVSTKMEALFDTEMIEYVCAENEKDRPHLVGKASDQQTVEVPVETLSKYVGRYEMPPFPGAPSDKPAIFLVTLAEGKLVFSVQDGPSAPLDAISQTEFAGLGGLLEFMSDDQGEVTHIIFRAVEGDFQAQRKK